jgi:hypothetical protein
MLFQSPMQAPSGILMAPFSPWRGSRMRHEGRAVQANAWARRSQGSFECACFQASHETEGQKKASTGRNQTLAAVENKFCGSERHKEPQNLSRIREVLLSISGSDARRELVLKFMNIDDALTTSKLITTKPIAPCKEHKKCQSNKLGQLWLKLRPSVNASVDRHAKTVLICRKNPLSRCNEMQLVRTLS